ncbi:MAG: hypothetical protein K2K24_02790, partial [Clostridia bacterium]|nr:hypothetical protein [Clostridia bacterium]
GSYKYYKDADYLGDDKEAGDNNIQLNEFEVPNPPNLGWYYAVAVLDELSAKNYEIVGGKSKRFSVGSDKIDVVVELNGGNYEFSYDGKPHGGVNELVLNATAGDLSASDLIIKYYNVDDETQEFSVAPTDSGRYKIVLALDDGFDDYKLLRTQINFEIKKVTIAITDNTSTDLYYNKDEQGLDLSVIGLTLDNIQITYYKSNGEEIDGKPINAGDYYALLSLSDELAKNYDLETARFEMTIKKVVLTVTTTTDKLTYDGQTHEVEFSVKEKVSGTDFDKDNVIKTYYKDSVLTENRLNNTLPIDARTYVVVYSLKVEADVNYEIENKQAGFVIDKVKVTAVWNTSEQIPILSNLDESTKAIIGYVYYDEDGNPLDDNAQLEAGKSYKVK